MCEWIQAQISKMVLNQWKCETQMLPGFLDVINPPCEKLNKQNKEVSELHPVVSLTPEQTSTEKTLLEAFVTLS